MIDIKKAENAFKEYLRDYDMEDDKVKLKVVHTYGVVKIADYLSKKLNLDEENTQLAKLIALLHDIGRFEQTKFSKDIYDKADKMFFDHGEYGKKILFEENLIRKFVEDNKYDSIICKAILNHNKLEIESGLNELELLHCKIIRDADKVDNFRVKLTESFKVLLGTDDTEKIFNDTISDKVYNDFMNKRLIITSDNKTCLDRWCSYIAFIFDMNFDESIIYLKENDLVNKCFNRIEYKNPKTLNQIDSMKKLADDYINLRCKKTKNA